MEHIVHYTYIPSLPNDEELTFKCLEEDCGLEVKASALRTHAAMAHNTAMYVTNMTTVRDDRRFTVKG